ncbi:MAG: methyltransferase [Planctomycetota bacterium]
MTASRWRSLRVSERSFNWAFGLSVCSWAVLGMLATDESALSSPVRWGIAWLNLLVGLLFIVRQPARSVGGVRDVLQALPALVVAGLALKIAPPSIGWSAWAQAVFLSGVALASWSFVWLGRCFAVLPARRGVVTRGPYRWVRHPAYAGELIMLLGCALTSGRWPGFVLLAAAVVLVCVRAQAEERVLSEDPGYLAYRRQTPSLLIPGRGLLGLLARSVNRRLRWQFIE